MTLVTTPGATDADSFASYAEYTAYCAARNITPSAEATAEVELRKGTTYLCNHYRDRWIGRRATQEQSLPWPRIDSGCGGVLYDIDEWPIASDAVPTQVKNATIEAALLVKAGVTLEPRLERGGAIKSLSEQVGPLATTTVWADGASITDRYMAIEGWLRGLVRSANSVRLVRA